MSGSDDPDSAREPRDEPKPKPKPAAPPPALRTESIELDDRPVRRMDEPGE